jgi:glycerol-3-phosphate dehydrogenase
LWRWHAESKVPLLSLIGGKLTTCRAFAEQTVRELLPKLGRTVSGTSRERPLRTVAAPDNLAAAAREAIRHQWATKLSDLVERRLMLVFNRDLSLAVLRELAQVLVTEKKLAETDSEAEVARYRDRLLHHFGRSG